MGLRCARHCIRHVGYSSKQNSSALVVLTFQWTAGILKKVTESSTVAADGKAYRGGSPAGPRLCFLYPVFNNSGTKSSPQPCILKPPREIGLSMSYVTVTGLLDGLQALQYLCGLWGLSGSPPHIPPAISLPPALLAWAGLGVGSGPVHLISS